MILDTHLRLPASHPEVDHLKEFLTRPNPAYENAQRMKLSTTGIAPLLGEYFINDEIAVFPRYIYHELETKTQRRVEDQTSLGENPNGHFLGIPPIDMRDYQAPAVTKTVKILREELGTTLQALMGSGKTVAALEIARILGLKTLVLVHTEFLMHQWRERAKQFLGVEAGIIQGDKCDTDTSLTIGMMQTLNVRDYAQLYNKYGLVIVDETHIAAAPMFSSVIQMFNARYRLGLTATPDRKDGLQWIFFSHIGPVKVLMERSEEFKVSPKVRIIETRHVKVPMKNFMRRGIFQYTTFVTETAENKKRSEYIITHVAAAAEAGRNIIVFSNRREHLKQLAELFEIEMRRRGLEPSYGFLVGKMKQAAREESQEKQVMFCTFQLAELALDVPRLDTAFLATPKSNIQQAVGRIERVLENKKDPIVVDYVDAYYPQIVAQANKRIRYYQSRGWNIE
jgi:superfamily II DNA or RNA helicase